MAEEEDATRRHPGSGSDGARTVFPGDVASVAGARRFVVAGCGAWGFDGLADDAALCTSEIVNNAVLHAAGDVEVVLTRMPFGVRIGVVDRSSHGLVRRRGGEDDTLGRGLAIVEALSSAFGVEVAGGGKCVWFELRIDGAPAIAPSPSTWALDGDGLAAGDDPSPARTVRLVDVPTRLVVADDDHVMAVARELSQVGDGPLGVLAARFVSSARASIDRRDALRKQAEAALLAGAEHLDVLVTVRERGVGEGGVDATPAALADHLRLWAEVDEACAAGRLLTLPSSPEVGAYRAWSAAEVRRQLEDPGLDPAQARTDPALRVALLAEAGRILGAAGFDVEEAVAAVARLLVPGFCDWLTLDLLQPDGGLRRRMLLIDDEALAAEGARWPAPRRSPQERVAAGGAPEVLPVIDDALLRSMAIDAAHLDWLRRSAPAAVVVVPLVGRSAVRGALGMGLRRPAPFAMAECAFAVDLGRRIGLAVENAHLFAEVERNLALLDTLVATSPIGIAVWDTDLRYARVNDALAEMQGIPVTDHIGRTVEQVDPAAALVLRPLLERVLLTGEPVLDLQVRGEATALAGEASWWIASLYPVKTAEGVLLGVGGVLVDATERTEAAAQLARSEERYRSLVRATSTVVFTVDRTGAATWFGPGWAELTGLSEPSEHLGWAWLQAIHPDDVAEAARAWQVASHEVHPVFEATYRVRRADGEWRQTLARSVPIIVDGEVREWIGTLVDVTVQRRAEEARAAAAARTGRLQEVTALLAAAAATDDVASIVVRTAADALGATSAVVLLVDDGAGLLRPRASMGPEDEGRDWRRSIGADDPVATAVAERRPVVISSVDELTRRWPDVEASMGAGRSWAVQPLVAPSGPIGALLLGFDDGRALQGEDLELLGAFAAACGSAIGRSELYERQRSIAAELQHGLLPEVPPTVGGLDVAVRYLPGSTDAEVGGDWYDVLEVAGGRVVLGLGDVVGKGLAAAAVMGQLRVATRAYAVTDPDPAAVLRRLDQLAPTVGPDLLATVALALVDPARLTVDVASAGHLPIVVVRPGEAAALSHAGRSVPIGAWMAQVGARRSQTITLTAGSTLLLCTDGLVEDRHRPLDEGLAQLCAAVDDAPVGVGVGTLCDHVFAAVLGHRRRQDDVALLAVRLPD